MSKTVTSVFHLHNNRSRRELNARMNGQRLKHDPYPVYLGVTLDQIFSCREHLSRSVAKLKSINNLIAKLAAWYFVGCQRKHPPHISLGSMLLDTPVVQVISR